MKGLDGGRINIATTATMGTAQAALERTLSYVGQRQQFGQPIGAFQHTQFELADMATSLAARQMVRLAAARLDGHPEATLYCAMAKRFATDRAFEVCNKALQLHGGYGYVREYPLERHLRDVRVHQILEGTNEIMRVIIARRMQMEALQRSCNSLVTPGERKVCSRAQRPSSSSPSRAPRRSSPSTIRRQCLG